ncbi:MAG: hypothetical protein NEA02_13710 [Thermoanaerobaculia bacterium]|nr:hypothetical protein [Thermoanaerobaculia bacterium]
MSRRPSSISRLTFVAGFVLAAVPAQAQNLISDPHFASGISAWSPQVTPGITTTLFRDPGLGIDGAPGFAVLTGGSFGPISYSARTCVPVQAGVVYSFGGAVRFRSSQGSSAVFWLSFFSDGACGTPVSPPPPAAASTGASGLVPDWWTQCRGIGATAPPGAASAALDFVLFGISTSQSPIADFDDVYVGRAGTVEPPFPVPLLSRAGILALGVALALAGALAIRPTR